MVILCPIDEGLVRSLVLDDAHLGVGIVLHSAFFTELCQPIAVEMVRRDVHQYADISAEIIHIIELERTYLKHIPVMIAFSHL